MLSHSRIFVLGTLIIMLFSVLPAKAVAKIDYHGFYFVTEVGLQPNYLGELKNSNNLARVTASSFAYINPQTLANAIRANNFRAVDLILDFNESLMTSATARANYLANIKRQISYDSDLIKLVAFIDIGEEEYTLFSQHKYDSWAVFNNGDGHYANIARLKQGLEAYITDVKNYFPNIRTKIVENFWHYSFVPPSNLDVLGLDTYMIPNTSSCNLEDYESFHGVLTSLEWAKEWGKPIYMVGPVFDDTHFRMLSACQTEWYINLAKSTPQVIGLDWFLYPDFPEIHMVGARNHGPIAYLKQQGAQIVAAANPVVPANNMMAKGGFDGGNIGTISGWTFDPDHSADSIRVHIYVADGPANGNGQKVLLAAPLANQSRPDVNAAFGITGLHGFRYTIPDKFFDGKTHTLYIYTYDIDEQATGLSNLLMGVYTFTLNSSSDCPPGQFVCLPNPI